MAYYCPACSRQILSRRTKLCGFCRAPLPAELLLTPEQIAQIEAAERARALAAKVRQEEREEARQRFIAQTDYSGG